MLIKRISLLKRAIMKTKILRRGIHDSNVLAGETIRSCRNVIQMLLSLASEHINTLTLWSGLLIVILIFVMSVMRWETEQFKGS